MCSHRAIYKIDMFHIMPSEVLSCVGVLQPKTLTIKKWLNLQESPLVLLRETSAAVTVNNRHIENLLLGSLAYLQPSASLFAAYPEDKTNAAWCRSQGR